MNTRRLRRRLPKLPTVLITLGVVSLVGVAVMWQRTQTWRARTVPVRGEIVRLIDVPGSTSVVEVIRFQTRGGKIIEAEAAWTTGARRRSSRPAVGSSRDVRYDPANPAGGVWLDDFLSQYFGAFFLGVFAFVFLFLGGIMFVLSRVVP